MTTVGLEAPDALATLRAQLDRVDASLIQALASRQSLVAEIGRIKHAAGKPLRDFQREREVLAHVRARAQQHGLPPDLAAEIMKLAIEASLATQEGDRLKLDARGDGRQALVFGGNGKMGRWFVRFLAAQGFGVESIDPFGQADECPRATDRKHAIHGADVIVLATPMHATLALLQELAACAPRGLVFDIASLKSPLQEGLYAARAAGLKICSLHPMFGPSVNLLSDRHVVLCDLGCAPAIESARSLFAPTSAQLVELSLQQHDHLMAWVLGLSHACNIVFLDALARSGVAAEVLQDISSTTFDRQLRVATSVANEDPALYHMIQHLQPHRGEVLASLRASLDRLAAASARPAPDDFTAMFTVARSYLSLARPASD